LYGALHLSAKGSSEADSMWIARPGLSQCSRMARRAAQLEAEALVQAKPQPSASVPWAVMQNHRVSRHALTRRVHMDVAIGSTPPRRMVIGLYGNAVPKTAFNFHSLCIGSGGRGYKGTTFHRVIPGFMAQGGGAADSALGGTFADESFELLHADIGTLSMANYGKDTNLAQFFITFGAMKHLDGKHVVFGAVLEGLDVLTAIERSGSRSGTPSVPITITDCVAI